MADAVAAHYEAKRRGSMAQVDVLRYRRAFDAYDHTKKGVVCADKVKEIASRLGYRITDSQLKSIMAENKLDQTSQIGFETFLELIPKNIEQIKDEEHQLAELRNKFQRYDLDGNGEISLNEAQWALQMELDVGPNTALRLLNQFVKLNYDQFVEFYQQVQKKKLEIYEKFGKYDLDLDGMISKDEAHQVLHEELGYTQERSAAMVAYFDTNKDGQVSYMEFAEFYLAVEEKKTKVRQAFQKFDPDGNGFVPRQVAEDVLQNTLGFSEQKCTSTLQNYDKDTNGKIDYEHFVEFFSMIEEERQKLLTEFKRFDADGDGKISLDELSTMLKGKGHSDTDIKSLMGHYDADQDGFLSFEEFKKFLNFS